MQVETTYKSIWKVALPVIAGSIAQTAIITTDTAFLGRVGDVTLGASAIGGIFYFVFMMLAFGLAIGSQIIIARRTGEGKPGEVGGVFDQSLYILGLFGVFLFMILKLLFYYGFLLHWWQHISYHIS